MEQANQKIGPYTLVSRIGRGAFGVVWLAEKRSAIATTRFALKMPRDEDIDIEAFKKEAEIWVHASGHPNVLPIIDADVYDGQVVIVSEYAPDGSLADWLKSNGGRAPTIENAVEIIDGVLAGLDHLHERRIIHRDLKPDNILLQRGTPRLADFGIARILKTSSHSANVSGTLAYMAPEAFDGKRNEQTDVWSVGIIFYQLLVGRLPYDQPDMASLIGAIMRYDPPPLSESVPESLRSVVMCALQRDATKRYTTAAAMRRALREVSRSLWTAEKDKEETAPSYSTAKSRTEAETQRLEENSFPIQSAETQRQPLAPTIASSEPSAPTAPSLPSQHETLKAVQPQLETVTHVQSTESFLWLRQNAARLIVLSLIIGIATVVSIYKWTTADLTKTTSNVNINNTTSSVDINSSLANTDVISFKLKQTLNAEVSIDSVAFSPDGRTLASNGDNGTLKLWDIETGTLKRTLTRHDAYTVSSVAFSPDGRTLASGSLGDGVKLWDTETGALKQALTSPSYAFSVAFSPDGAMLAIGFGGNFPSIRLWNMQTGKLRQNLTGYGSTVNSVAFSPDGKTLAGGSADKTIKLWDVETGTLKRTLTMNNSVESVAFSPDGMMLAGGNYDSTINLWDAQTGALKRTLKEHLNGVESVAFSTDGKILASGSLDNSVDLWDTQTGTMKQALMHKDSVTSVTFSTDRKMFASGSNDKTIKLWTVVGP